MSGNSHNRKSGELEAVVARRGELLQSIVEVARAIFIAQAASIALLDLDTGQFVFEAVAGRGDEIIGSGFPAGEGLAGVVAQRGEPLIVDDLSTDPRFARNVAAKTGYVPDAMMVAPLAPDELTIGVLSILDRGPTGRSALQELDLLAHFASQAGLAVQVTDAAARAVSQLQALRLPAELAERLARLDDDRRDALVRLLAAAEDFAGM